MPLFAEVPEDFAGWDWLALPGLLTINYVGRCRNRMPDED
jgi:hypothetical protein